MTAPNNPQHSPEDKANENQREKDFIDHTQWVAEFELMDASHRFLKQFASNPFSHMKMKEYSLQTPRSVPEPKPGFASAAGSGAATPTASTGDDHGASPKAGATDGGATSAMSEQYSIMSGSAAVSAAESPIRITTTKAPFKLNPEAKEFVPDPNLIVTPWGILPKNKALPPHLRDRVDKYDPELNEGYRAYYGHVMDEFNSKP